ncbi:uncharacterized protein GIQ15_06072 [Arthroderma uncinatum]|uniref:uncharacterized protein n=1 Tax=Arthroderma uncinatum TaxID=74035 RepID=UPI00144AE474|nr:uncharacterized protein GIQ15_06072 [Arthroderma uncinatum]KAF3480725.1 hypothetical protein GIQ15_06072 [Arthroderma uncinatum]
MAQKSPIIVPKGFNASPSSSSSSPDATSSAPRSGTTPEKSLPYERPSFTFIGQDEESTLKGRKGSDTRKMIRSHVMRDVRRRERIAGLKRVSKKASARKNDSSSSSDGSSTAVITHRVNDRGVPTAEAYSGLKAPPSWVTLKGSNIKGQHIYIFHNPLAHPIYPTIEPMSTLKGCEGLGHVVSNLLHYSTDKEESILPDPTFYVMKAKCIAEMNQKLRDPDPQQAVDDTAIDIVCGLISATLTLALFEEARVHWLGMKKIVDYRGGVLNMAMQGSRGIGAVLTCDLKSACTLLSRPLFPLAWEPQPLPSEVRDKITPPPTSQLSNLANTLCANKHLSPMLNSILQEVRDVFFFEVFHRTDPSGLTAAEHEMFLMKGHEIEHELLDYPYRSPEAKGLSDKEILHLNPIETVTRLTTLSYLSTCFVVSPPKSGTGRAVTKNLKDALARCFSKPISALPSEDLSLLAWVTFISIASAYDPLLRSWFVEILHDISIIKNWQTWEQVESVMHGYLYAAPLHGHIWKKLWFEAQSFNVIKEIL